VPHIPLIAAMSAGLLLAGCSYSTESSFLGYRSSTSFSTPGAAPPPGNYAPPPAYSTAPPPQYPASPDYTEAPVYGPAYYGPPPVYYGPSVGLFFGRSWGRGRWRR
jgi:hypothetical protein